MVDIETRARALWSMHYASRPGIKRDESGMEFYRRIAADELAGKTQDHEEMRKALGGSFE